jgi:predicted nucleic acid-binding protein
MAGYLLDTNHVGSAVKPGAPVRQRIRVARSRGERLGVCVPVLCELQVGAQQVNRAAEYQKALRRLLAQIRIWPLDMETARLYGEIYLRLKADGRVLSQVDMMLAALARQMNLTLLTSDGDFDALPEIAPASARHRSPNPQRNLHPERVQGVGRLHSSGVRWGWE